MRLKDLTIAGFRGFRLPQTIPLDANIVIIYGLNGSGKSSMVEALEWLLLGDISRHERARSRSEYRGSLCNIHCTSDELTFVEARVVVDSREIVIRREYQSAQRYRILVDGSEVSDLTSVGIAIESYTRPMLSQGEIKSFVDAEQAERHKEISYILGLDILGDLRRSLLDLKNNLTGDTTISQATMLRNARSADLRQYEEVNSLSDAIDSLPYNHQECLNKIYSQIWNICGAKVNSLEQCQNALKVERDNIIRYSPTLSKLNELRVPGEVIPTSELLQVLQAILKIIDQLESISGQMIEMRLAHFLREGLELVTNSTCPLCLQSTMTDERKNDIGLQLQTFHHGLKLEDKLRDNLDNFSNQWRTVYQNLQYKVGIEADVKVALDEALQILGVNSDTKSLREFCDSKLPELQSQVTELYREVEQFKQSCTNLLDHKPDLSIPNLISLANKIYPEIESVCAKVYGDINNLTHLKSKMLSSTPGISPEMDRKLKIIIALESLIENSQNIRLAGVFDNKLEDLKTLQDKIEEFERAKMSEMLNNLSQEISYYYDKLNPDEPIRFARLGVASAGLRQVRIEGESYGQNINPVSCFSEAHVNCLGLSLYFCQRVNRNLQCKFFMLDDPVQSMDEQHVDRLVDVLREISQEKQLIVFTHQKGLCDILDDVFRDSDYIKYTCGPYNKDGPQIELETGGIEKSLQLAKLFSRGSRDDRINKSAGSIRKAMEAIVKELITDKCGIPRAVLRAQRVKLSRRLRQLENSGFNQDDIVSLRTILPIIDQPHHDDPNWDIAPQRIKRAVEILERMSQKYKIGPYHVARNMVGEVKNYLSKIGVAVIEVQQPISIGDKLLIEGSTTYLEMQIESMEQEHEKIESAEPGAIVGIIVPNKVRANDRVYKITEDQ